MYSGGREAESIYSFEVKSQPGGESWLVISCTTPNGLTSRMRVPAHEVPEFIERLQSAGAAITDKAINGSVTFL
jgi:hypothetical protein